ncbi:MAG: response regulator transcription factor [Bacteroidetes bacterium]|nr:response regulator transcription factor [Bacteroidota bacterium]
MTNQINCICVDDEPLALEVMENLIGRYPNLKLTRKCANALEAMEWLKNNHVDVVFTDINMPGVTGIDFAKAIDASKTVVVFSTAHQEYAAEAFEIEALDFLLKPISPERFGKTIKRIEEYFELRNNKSKDNVELEEGHMFVKSDSKLLKIAYSEIQYVEAFADYVKIWIGDDKRIVTLQTMKNMEAGLPKEKFIRVHRSFIVAIDKIGSLQSNSVQIGNKEIPVGKNYKDGLMQLISNMNLMRR